LHREVDKDEVDKEARAAKEIRKGEF